MSDRNGVRKPCMFCGGTTEKLTVEHYPPQGIEDLLETKIARLDVILTRSDGTQEHRRNLRPWTACVRGLCGPCNSTWLSPLEDRNRRALAKLINSKRCRLTPVDQEALAAWSFKSACVQQPMTDRADDTIPPHHMREFHLTRKPPQGVHIFIGRRIPAVGEGSWEGIKHTPVNLSDEVNGIPLSLMLALRRGGHAYRVAFALFGLAVLVTGHDTGLRLSRSVPTCYHQIWPIRETFSVPWVAYPDGDLWLD